MHEDCVHRLSHYSFRLMESTTGLSCIIDESVAIIKIWCKSKVIGKVVEMSAFLPSVRYLMSLLFYSYSIYMPFAFDATESHEIFPIWKTINQNLMMKIKYMVIAAV
jgi:hypothetical protein